MLRSSSEPEEAPRFLEGRLKRQTSRPAGSELQSAMGEDHKKDSKRSASGRKSGQRSSSSNPSSTSASPSSLSAAATPFRETKKKSLPSKRTHHSEEGSSVHAHEGESIEVTPAGSADKRTTTEGKGRKAAARSQAAAVAQSTLPPSSSSKKDKTKGVGSGRVVSVTEEADSTGRTASSSTAVLELNLDDAWLSVDLDADFVNDNSYIGSMHDSEEAYLSTEIPPSATPDSPRSPDSSAGRLTIQEVHGLPGAFMSTGSGYYVHSEAEAIRHIMEEDPTVDEGRSSFMTTPTPQAAAPTNPPSPGSLSQPVEPPNSQPTGVQASLNEILVEARPVVRSRSFNSEDEYYSYGSDDLNSADPPVGADSLPSASVQRRRSTRRGNRASRLMSVRQQFREMDGTDPPPLLVDAQPIPKTSRVQTWVLAGLGALAIIVALAVGLSLGLTRPSSSSSPAGDIAPTMAPSSAPTSSLAGEFRSSLPASTQASLENVTSPQSLAFQYVVTHSGTTESNARLERMTQQFALLALFFSTSGEEWSSPWINTTASDVGTIDECLWADQGVTCDANQTVVQLSLPDSSLRGTVPREIALLKQLVDLNLASNQLLGSLPSEIGSLIRLTNLELNGNRMSGPLPTELGNLTMLGNLDLRSNSFTGTLPSEVGRLTGLTSLNVGTNGLSGAIPTEIGYLTQLTGIELMENSFNSTLPTELGLLTLATKFRIDGNELTGQLPTEIGKLTRLTMIYAYSTGLNGTIPTEIGNLVELTYIAIDTNYMVGTIPTELGRLTNVNTFWAYNTQLQGSLPSELGNMITLQDFNVSGTISLLGTIPPQLGNLTRLTNLDVSSNELSGTIPTELARLESLELLYLNENRLTGTVPDGLGGLAQLKELRVEDNVLNGTIVSDGELCQRVASDNLIVHVNCSEVLCDCGCQCS